MITTGYKKSLNFVGQKKAVYAHSMADVSPHRNCLDYVQGVTMACYLDDGELCCKLKVISRAPDSFP